jgi:hypothetical protein
MNETCSETETKAKVEEQVSAQRYCGEAGFLTTKESKPYDRNPE